MLVIVEKSTGSILERIEAWDCTASAQAQHYCDINGLTVVETSITLLGDWVWYVE